MPQTQAEVEAELITLRARKAASAGIRATAFGDQSTQFDHEDLDKRIATLERQLATVNRGSTTRYAATSKGL